MEQPTPSMPRLALGAIGYYWSKDQVDTFYQQIAQTPIDIVYLGEAICSKRNEVRYEDWLTIAEQLTAAGKEVVLTTLSLLEAESELIRLRSICSQTQYLVEANDIGAVHLLQGRPFVVGHSVNIYNDRTLALLAKQGMKRWVLPVELTADTLQLMQQRRPPQVETEVLVYGRLPLAYSARCFTARARNLPKDDCRYCCIDYPDGLEVATQDQQRFLVLNGIQTLSSRSVNLIHALPQLREYNVDILRIAPQEHAMTDIITLLDDARHNRLDPQEAAQQLDRLTPSGSCDGYWYGEAGMELHKN
jgi:collagenase-like PrtC family protease